MSWLCAMLILVGTTTTSPIHAQSFSQLTLIVNSTMDADDAAPGDGFCSTGRLLWPRSTCTLRAAVMEANAYPGPDTIIFGVNGTFTLTIPGAGEDRAASGDVDITESVTIRGNGVQQTIIDGGGTAVNDRVFHIDPAGSGPAVSISFVTVQNGNAVPSSEGGGIVNGICRATGIPGCSPSARESSLTMDHVVIRSNSVGGIAFASGGGIANNGFLHLTHSTIDGNNATVSGGLDNGLVSRAELDQVLISNNTASLNTQGAPYGAGGGVFNGNTATMSIIDSQVTKNDAPLGSGAGIANYGELTLEELEISSNESGYYGGGILNGGLIDASLVTISDNTAISGGGGIYNGVDGNLMLQSATINNNSANSSVSGGGGIRNIGTMTLTNVTLSENRANRGGAIYNGNQSASSLAATLN